MGKYIEFGALAMDAVDGHVKVEIQGVDQIDVTTASEMPYQIYYTAKDAAGNMAIPVIRKVVVVNPCAPPAKFCVDLVSIPRKP